MNVKKRSEIRRKTRGVLPSVVEVNGAVQVHSSCEKDHEMPNLMTTSTDVELIGIVALWEPTNVDKSSKDVNRPSNSHEGRREGVEQFSISKSAKSYL